ncbi:serine/threonine-protein phosphatase 6 regulatory ankyrin repeat subunit B-like [Physella acuta]|uniref:serine/threonine-protein phosphatase 6 regulatory ankyrin repeat subunit B-like n=1 Tax=Physella acuta TaxID=109671 RepID=UPI0027DD6E14|nr:serine/threonine-protein phosphatase 6 regulatory ankyrin repeat subunit B-like [Physella acuta]
MDDLNSYRIVMDVFNKAKSGDKGRLQSSDINRINMDRVSALMMSVIENNILALKTLISAGADVNVTSYYSRDTTALTIAVERRRVECVKELIRAGASFTCKQGFEALMMARDNNFLDAVVEGEKVSFNQHALTTAYKNEHFDLIVDLINCGITNKISSLRFEDVARDDVFNAIMNSPNININERYWEGQTMLMKAVQTNKMHIVQFLFQKGVNIHEVDGKGNTALHFAYGGKSEIISLLLAAGAEVDVKNSEHQTPLHVAANASDTEMINLLIEAKADINCLDKRWQTPLAICVENSDLNTATCLLRHGAEVNTVNNHGFTPLIRAVTKQDEQLVELLIVHKADVNFTDHKQTTALIYALMNVNKHIVSKLIQAGADVNIKTAQFYRSANGINYDLWKEAKKTLLDSSSHNLTPLHIAAQTFLRHPAQKSVELVNILLEGGANALAVDEDDRTPLHIAAIFGDLGIIKSLCQSVSNINAVDKFGNTPLFLSLLYNHQEPLKYLMESGADVNLMSESQCSPLYVAVFCKNTELVRILLKHGALADKGRHSELLKALEHNDVNMSTLLVKNGANTNVKDNNQIPALIIVLKRLDVDIASKPRIRTVQIDQIFNSYKRKRPRRGQPSRPPKVFVPDKELITTKTLIESMLQHGANVSLADIEGNTCLHEAARYCSKKILKLLLQHKAEVNQQNVNGETPLMIACVSGNVEAAEVLLKAGANVFLVDKNKNTALHHCVQYGIEFPLLVEKLVLHSNQNNVEFRQENTIVNEVNLIANAYGKYLHKIETNSNCQFFINMTNSNKESAIYIACSLGHGETVTLLISNKCNLDCATSTGKTPLMIASQRGFPIIVQSLIKNNADINIRDKNGETALHAAVKSSNLHIASFLVENGANVNEQNNAGQTPLFYAESYEDIKCIIKCGAEINIKDRTGETALHCRSKLYNYSIIYALLQLGANPDITTDEGITALMIAVNVGYSFIVKTLVDNGANVNIQDCKGRNACMHSVMGVKNKEDSYLGINKYFNNNQGHYIRNERVIRKADGLFETINVLVTAGANLNTLDNENRSLIVYTLLNVKKDYQEECILRLLKLGVDPILHENHRYLLNEFILQDSRCVRTVLNDDSKIIFQFLLINGITLCHSVSNYTRCPESNFTCAARNKNFDFLRFFLATGFIYTSDLTSLRKDKYFKDDADVNLNSNDSLYAQLAFAKREPWPLVKLAFIEVSTLLGTGPMREEKLKQTKLPPRLQRTLMFQEPISRLPVEDWSKIPLCFDPVQYETLPCPRPLLYYWPFGHRLVI